MFFICKNIELPPHQEQGGEGRRREGRKQVCKSSGKGRGGKEGERGQALGMGEGKGGKGQRE